MVEHVLSLYKGPEFNSQPCKRKKGRGGGINIDTLKYKQMPYSPEIFSKHCSVFLAKNVVILHLVL